MSLINAKELYDSTDIPESQKDELRVIHKPNYSNFIITNLNAPVANTEVSHALAFEATTVYLKPRKDAIMRMAIVANGTNVGPYLTVPSGQGFILDTLRLSPGLILYIQTDKANNIIEILEKI